MECLFSVEEEDLTADEEVRGMGRCLLDEGVGESVLDPPIASSLSSSDDDESHRSSSCSSSPVAI